MLQYLKYAVVVIVSFVFTMELLDLLSFTNNLLEGSKEPVSYFPDPSAESVVFIGDSYAATNYVEDGFPVKFKAFFEEKGYNFINLSRPGTELKWHLDVMDSIKVTHAAKPPKMIVYYYNLSDVASFTNGKISATAGEKGMATRPKKQKAGAKKKNKKSTITLLIDRSASLQIVKDILHRISLFFNDRPFPGTSAASFPKLNLKYKEELRTIFNSIEAEQVIILINTRFNFGTRMTEWEHYQMFKDMELNDNVSLVQSIDIVPDDEHGVSWRNGHPNQKAIDIVADRIMSIADEMLGTPQK